MRAVLYHFKKVTAITYRMLPFVRYYDRKKENIVSELAITQPVTNKASTPEATSQSSNPKKMETWKKVLIGAAVFFVVLVIIANMSTAGPSAASNDFINNVLNSNGATAYNMMSSEAKKTVTAEDFAAMAQRLDSILDNNPKMISKNVYGETGSAATGTVVYEVAGTDGTYILTVNLMKENGTWKVVNFESSLKR